MQAARPSSRRRRCPVPAPGGASRVVTWHTLPLARCRYAGVPSAWYVGVPREVTMTAVLPDGPTSPRLVQSLSFALSRRRTMERLRARYGSAFTVQSLNLGRMVMLADPGEVREMFQASPDE